MNKKIGMIAALISMVAVLTYSGAMIAGVQPAGAIARMLIAWSFIPITASLAAFRNRGSSAASNTALAFAAGYAVVMSLIAFNQATSIPLKSTNENSAALLALLDAQQVNSLFFSYELLGCALLGLATFFSGLTIETRTKQATWLKGMLIVHGAAGLGCAFFPLQRISLGDLPGGNALVTYLPFIWCAYFLIVSILAFQFFLNQPHKNGGFNKQVQL